MKNYKVVLEVTKFGTEGTRMVVDYEVKAKDTYKAYVEAIKEAANDCHYVDEAALVSIEEI